MVSSWKRAAAILSIVAALAAWNSAALARPVESVTTTQPAEPVVASQPAEPEPAPPPAAAPAEETQATPADAEPATGPEKPASEPPAELPADTATQPQTAPAETPQQTQPAEPEPEIKARFELHVPSVEKLISEVKRSRTGLFVDYLSTLVRVMSTSSSKGVSTAEADAVVATIRAWPDTAVHFSAFAPDREGLARWALSFDWSAEDLRGRLAELLALEGADELFAGIKIADEDGATIVRLEETPLAYVWPSDDGGSVLASHRDLPLPKTPYRGTADTEADGRSLLVCRMNMSQTEKDTGETFLSNFNVITAIDYGCHVNEAGDWADNLFVYWPPISGMALKAMFGRVEQTFFVPEEAFGGVVFNTMMAPAMIEQTAGFGPQAMMDSSGGLIIVGEASMGPLAGHIKDSMCITVLPGTGFLPAPDIVVQMRGTDTDTFAKDIREATKKINQSYEEREMTAPWHEADVRDRSVFWCDTGAQNHGMMMPFVMRPVLFVTRERDDDDKDRDFVVVAWTTTDPQDLVRRWLDMPRPMNRRFLPSQRKTNGQAWVHWKKLYEWLQPYANLTLAMASPDAMLPRVEKAEGSLVDGVATAKVRYSGLTVTHTGPAPMGIVALPAMVSSSMAIDWSGSSDLARERLACERLKVLYHHSKLFKKDVGRWPAEVRELDGYVDFAGHPYLLHLRLSSRQRWSNFFDDMFGDEDEDEQKIDDEEDEDDLYSDIDDSLYVIDWGKEHWTLGIAPGKLDHLEKLYIDQDGEIHRIEKTTAAKGETETEDAAKDEEAKI